MSLLTISSLISLEIYYLINYIDFKNMTANEDKEIDIAYHAINLILNNEWVSCENLLIKQKYILKEKKHNSYI